MPAREFAATLGPLSLNLIVPDVAESLPFYTGVLQLTVLYSDADFAALESASGWRMMLHADHTLDHSALETARLQAPGRRGTGAEIRILGLDPDGVEARARAGGYTVNAAATTYPHGWRECRLEDRHGFTFAVGILARTE
jgi:catechol 2,3-dioxygenase-like lactoylglutathione lyase family enzyme